MIAGRELDALIGFKVMDLYMCGCEKGRNGPLFTPGELVVVCYVCKQPMEYPKYSSEIRAAWSIVEENETRFRIQYDRISDMWEASFGASSIQDSSAPMAICLAILRERGIEFE